MNRESLSVIGMSCDGCERNVENALQAIDGVTRADADHEEDTVEVVVENEVANDDLHDAIERAGYDVAV